ncbi:MAG: hypothetical protein ACAI38_11765 [Myxococcota bacterium]
MEGITQRPNSLSPNVRELDPPAGEPPALGTGEPPLSNNGGEAQDRVEQRSQREPNRLEGRPATPFLPRMERDEDGVRLRRQNPGGTGSNERTHRNGPGEGAPRAEPPARNDMQHRHGPSI